VQGGRVQQRLQRVVRGAHRRRHRGPAVVPGGERFLVGPATRAACAEPVRLVVHHHEPRPAPVPYPQHGVDRAGEEAPQRPRPLPAGGQRREVRGVAGERVVRREVAVQQVRHATERRPAVRGVSARERQLELELVQPVRRRHVHQPPTSRERPERRPQRGEHRVRDVVGTHSEPLGARRGGGAREGPGQAGIGEVHRLEHGVHHGAEGRPAGKVPERGEERGGGISGRPAGGRRRSGVRRARGRDVGLVQHPGRLRLGGDRRCRGVGCRREGRVRHP